MLVSYLQTHKCANTAKDYVIVMVNRNDTARDNEITMISRTYTARYNVIVTYFFFNSSRDIFHHVAVNLILLVFIQLFEV